jgi:glucose/arabinose dehydrogenase
MGFFAAAEEWKMATKPARGSSWAIYLSAGAFVLVAALAMQLEAWGFRNPYGIGFDPSNKNQLFVSNNGADCAKQRSTTRQTTT